VIRLAGAYVVVERRAIEVIGNGITQPFAAMFLPTADTAAAFVQLPFAASRADKPMIRLLLYRGGVKRRRYRHRRWQHKLLARHLMLRLGPGHGGGLHYGQIQPGEGARSKGRQRI
jgi:hypothetical protein